MKNLGFTKGILLLPNIVDLFLATSEAAVTKYGLSDEMQAMHVDLGKISQWYKSTSNLNKFKKFCECM